jgi:CelD/BcsL family acetyltransferase involved in cellulose biosynthesis
MDGSNPFRVLRVDRPQERRAWIALWEQSPAREVFAHPAYLECFRERDDYACCCATMASELGSVLYPFYLRPLRDEDRAEIGGAEMTDICTPYGYGGPGAWGATDPDRLATAFWGGFDDWAARENVVSEFVRFSLFGEDLLAYPGQVESPQNNVIRSLDLSEEDLWSEVRHKVRKNVKRARSTGLEVVVDSEGDRLREFLDIYHGTMDRRNADAAYYFDAAFFQRLCDSLAGQYVFFHALSGGEVVATELVLVSRRTVYSFLGGTDPAHFANRPNDLLKYEIMLWAKSASKHAYVLGGGKSPDDGIYKYKEAFAPNGVRPFYVGKRVLDDAAYRRLTAAKSKPATAGYFPAYRAA